MFVGENFSLSHQIASGFIDFYEPKEKYQKRSHLYDIPSVYVEPAKTSSLTFEPVDQFSPMIMAASKIAGQAIMYQSTQVGYLGGRTVRVLK